MFLKGNRTTQRFTAAINPSRKILDKFTTKTSFGHRII